MGATAAERSAPASQGRSAREEARGERSERSGVGGGSDGGSAAAPRRAATNVGDRQPSRRGGMGSPPRRAPSRHAEARAALQASIAAARQARVLGRAWGVLTRRCGAGLLRRGGVRCAACAAPLRADAPARRRARTRTHARAAGAGRDAGAARAVGVDVRRAATQPAGTRTRITHPHATPRLALAPCARAPARAPHALTPAMYDTYDTHGSYIQDEYEELGLVLGRGAFSSVLSVRRRATGRPFAAKCVHSAGLTGDARRDALRAALTEASVLARLRHPGVIACHDVVMERKRACLLLERCEGGTLLSLVQARVNGSKARAAAAARRASFTGADGLGLSGGGGGGADGGEGAAAALAPAAPAAGRPPYCMAEAEARAGLRAAAEALRCEAHNTHVHPRISFLTHPPPPPLALPLRASTLEQLHPRARHRAPRREAGEPAAVRAAGPALAQAG
jgi:hypothetical protein